MEKPEMRSVSLHSIHLTVFLIHFHWIPVRNSLLYFLFHAGDIYFSLIPVIPHNQEMKAYQRERKNTTAFRQESGIRCFRKR
ncbi:MAG: hypothetical protein C4527_12740 [Candidatus Omnitrophota bacterium]|nr:MAG: hypothetical protein C4527_12740 [Candidatus Omnitrophota bacterium]